MSPIEHIESAQKRSITCYTNLGYRFVKNVSNASSGSSAPNTVTESSTRNGTTSIHKHIEIQQRLGNDTKSKPNEPDEVLKKNTIRRCCNRSTRQLFGIQLEVFIIFFDECRFF